jgi:hypothetical protein
VGGDCLSGAGPQLVGGLPDLEQAHGGVEAVVDGQRHGHVRDDGPRPHAEEVEVRGPELGAILLEAVDGPHGQVGYQQERDQLPAGLASHVRRVLAATPPRVQDEDGLARGLHQRQQLGQQAAGRRAAAEEAAHHAEQAVDVHARLRHHDQHAVQRQAVRAAPVLELPHLQHAHQHGHRARAVQHQLAHGHLKM